MKKIGVISDTHGFLDAKFLEFFSDCDEVWHAGDIGNADILTDLASLVPVVRAVYGNIDDWDVRTRVPEVNDFELEGKKVLIKHICGRPGRYDTSFRPLITQIRPDIVVCGHSHILRVEYDKRNNFLFINPGAAGKSGFHKVRTAVKFILDSGDVRDLKVLELPR